MKTPDEHLQDAINYIKTCAYKGTAIKIELEGELDRNSDYCRVCGENGFLACDECSGTGVVPLVNQGVTCGTCNGDGELECSACRGKGSSYQSEDLCKEFLLDHVSTEARNALIFSRFYDDGSVDSEFTFTLPITKVRYAVEFIKAFKALADRIGSGIDVDGAGMHISILNSPSGNYPAGNKLSLRCNKNFAKSMTHLLPALFFLGSADHHSRGLSYRYPQINKDSKHSAISGGATGSSYEYRVFETCYDHPERIFDFVCVIAKTLRFYRQTQKKCPFFNKIGDFGFKDGSGLERFYYTRTHLEALRAGVEYLKPEYKTFQQLRKERNFKLTFKKIDDNDRKRRFSWIDEWRSLRQTVDIDKLRVKAKEAWNTDPYARETCGGNFNRYFQEHYGHLIPARDQKEYITKKHQEFTQQNVEAVITV